VAKSTGVKVLTIPSPARRDDGMSWVIDTVPLVPPRREARSDDEKAKSA
jgi:hypothetical protein